MSKELKFELNSQVVEDLITYSSLLKKDVNTILNEALEQYFQTENEKLLEKNQEDHNSMTNLDFNEFWDDVDI
jgi:tRNA A37 N6-isopentenylltransferase MiaA